MTRLTSSRIFALLIGILTQPQVLAQTDHKAAINPSSFSQLTEQVKTNFQSLRGKQFAISINEQFQQQSQHGKRTYDLTQNCMEDGFRSAFLEITTQELLKPDAQIPSTEFLWTPNENQMSVTTITEARNAKEHVRQIFFRSSEERVPALVGSNLLFGLVWGGERTWDLSDPEFWKQAEFKQSKNGQMALHCPSGQPLKSEIKVSEKSKGKKPKLAFTLVINDENGEYRTTYAWRNGRLISMKSKYNAPQASITLMSEFSVIGTSRADGVREFQHSNIKVGDQFRHLENARTHEYLGKGNAREIVE